MYHYRFVSRIEDIPATQWNRLTGTDYPFLRHEFLHALESSGSVGEQRGWQPEHLVIEADDALVAVLPLYRKSHSYGEYVFDWSWADAYHHHGIDYYPKLLSAIPFTPASGPRLACHDDCDRGLLMATLSQALQTRVEQSGASGWHLLFPDLPQLNLLQTLDADLRLGCQFHWFNQGFGSFDDFLASFSSRKRKDVRKERQRVVQQGLTLTRLCGEAIDDDAWQLFYHCYQATYAKRSGHGGYLTEAFFQQLRESMPEQLMMVVAHEGEQPIAAALYFFSSTTLYGRYWGALAERDGLHFEACYYQGIEFCIERGLATFDAGAQGEHKISRGFTPTLTYSLHYLHHPQFRQAVQHFLEQESEATRQYQQAASSSLPFKAGL